ncbi:recombinase RecT [Niameybacter massiliensis]|uniref:recombinase RecT n=1 Tax=Niameybacter massiliensis TaxID=1658108 RepID=UPI0006B67E59|nr:RecT family recombinase [Niameybacter massiliensis]
MSDNQVAVKPQKEITDSVLAKVNKLQENKSLVLPQNYVAGNALQSAALILAETVDNAKKPVLESCTKESIANSLLDMVKMGLEPSKKQCYFVAFGGKLQLMTSYFGKLAIAKRVSGLEEVKAFVIYEGDEFEMEFNIDDLTMQLKTYKPNPLNVNLSKITGAFAIPIFKDGTRGDLVYMSYDQIQKSWNQGYAKGKSGAHTNFTDEMCKKTIITRVCKTLINSSDDGDLIDTYQGADEESTPTPQAEQKEMTASKEFVDVPFVEDKQEVPAQVTAPTQEEIVCPI